MYCLQCNKFTTNDKFCSRSCAASYNNKVKPKRIRKPSNCKTCNKPIQSRRSYCLDCNPFYVDWAKITFGDVISRRRYQAHSRIRDLARNIYIKSDKPKCCLWCNYDKHFEVCHILPIYTFSHETSIAEINNLNYLIALCPTHHWELDHGLLQCQIDSLGNCTLTTGT
jgi:hypothetical protein